MGVIVRLATNEDGPRIGDLARASGYNVEAVDWTDISPFWLVAEEGGQVGGAVQMALGKPFGRMEMLVVELGWRKRKRAAVAKALVYQGLATLKASGAQLCMAVVPLEAKAWKKVLERRGAVVDFTGQGMTLRL